MDNGALTIVIVVSVLALIVGALIGFLMGRQKAGDVENRLAGAEALSAERDKQLSQKAIEYSRISDQLEREQTKRLEAETARTEVETRLSGAALDLDQLRESVEAKDLEITSYRNAHAASEKKCAELQAKNDAVMAQLEEQKQFLAGADEKLREAFKALSSDALENNNSTFLTLAKQQLEAKVTESAAELETRKQAIEGLVKPLGESLEKFDTKLNEIEIKREGAYKGIETWLDVMRSETTQLNAGTKKLVNALTTSHVRGRYGEIALRRLVEAAGMLDKCHFAEQETVTTETGKLRPDMTLFLPGERQLIVDSKVPMAAYNRIFETEDNDEQKKHLKAHATAVRDHVKKLSDKSYWEQFEQAPDFVIMYLEFESCYGAALMHDPELLFEAMNNRIVFATPSTFLGLLRTVNYMWQQVRLADGILEIRDAGFELYKRTNTMLDHFTKVGSGLLTAVNSYNSAVASVETRVITQLEKIKEIGGALVKDEPTTLKHIESSIRPIIKRLEAGDEKAMDSDGSSALT